MDYREVNSHIHSHPGPDSAVCPEKLRKWRRMGTDVRMIDLRNAYLKIYVDQTLQPYQCVLFKGRTYVMTRMGFGLSIAPKVMGQILSRVLSLDPQVAGHSDNYIDDIICETSAADVEKVQDHLRRHGLETKPSAV